MFNFAHFSPIDRRKLCRCTPNQLAMQQNDEVSVKILFFDHRCYNKRALVGEQDILFIEFPYFDSSLMQINYNDFRQAKQLYKVSHFYPLHYLINFNAFEWFH